MNIHCTYLFNHQSTCLLKFQSPEEYFNAQSDSKIKVIMTEFMLSFFILHCSQLLSWNVLDSVLLRLKVIH